MTEFTALLVPDRGQPARTIHLIDEAGFPDWLKQRSAEDRAVVAAHGFEAKKPGSYLILPRGNEFEVVAAVKDADALTPWCLAALADKLPAGTYKLAEGEPGAAGLGWLLAQHRFDAYRSKVDDSERGPRALLSSNPARIEEAVRLAIATSLVRDLVNAPASDLGPAELEKAAADLASRFGADLRVTKGDDLTRDYPLIAAVGRAAAPHRAPRLIELEWGKPEDPRIAIVGKGVCFDSGGLDLKPASGMRLMKKDMGGAAHALALAQLIIEARLPVRLHLLIPAVENAVSGDAFRPGDIIKSRKGLFVEIDNTDAEGRLVLADALDKAVEAEPRLIVDFATLTGAARVALGPELPAFFCNDDDLAAEVAEASRAVEDPLWRMPLWQPYEEMLKSDIADLANASATPMAGAVVAAIFLNRFIPDEIGWAHLDTYAWRDSARPGRPKGGEALGLRAVFATLQARFARP
jgi:leucyl aminopeptidase